MSRFIEGKSRSLPAVFTCIFGNLPLPTLVYAGDSDRQQDVTDCYTRQEDLPYLRSAHFEMRFLLSLLVTCIRSQTQDEDSETVNRIFVSAQLLRDMIDGFLDQCRSMDPTRRADIEDVTVEPPTTPDPTVHQQTSAASSRSQVTVVLHQRMHGCARSVSSLTNTFSFGRPRPSLHASYLYIPKLVLTCHSYPTPKQLLNAT